MTKKLKRKKRPDEEEHNRPMRAALRPISPRSRNGASAGSRPARLPNVTAPLPPSPPARRPSPPSFPPSHNSSCSDCIGRSAAAGRREAEAAGGRCFCTARGGKRRQSLARPPVRPPALSAPSSSPLHCGTWLHLTSGLPVGRRTDGGRPPCLQTRSSNDVSDVAKNWFRTRVSLAAIPCPRYLSNSDAA